MRLKESNKLRPTSFVAKSTSGEEWQQLKTEKRDTRKEDAYSLLKEETKNGPPRVEGVCGDVVLSQTGVHPRMFPPSDHTFFFAPFLTKGGNETQQTTHCKQTRFSGDIYTYV